MTEDEIEAVAVELARAGGVSWYPGQERGPLKLVLDRYRERARLAIAALERARAARTGVSIDSGGVREIEPSIKAGLDPLSGEAYSVGSLVLYRPPGDRRSYPCRIKKVEGSRVYLVPEITTCPGWVDLNDSPSSATQ